MTTAPKAPDERWFRNLLVARQLLEHASRQADGTEPGAVAAVVLSDLAVETVAKVAIAAKPPTSHPGAGYQLGDSARRGQGRDPSLPAVLDNVLASWREAHGDDTLDAVEIREALRLRAYRNIVQHDAVVPAGGDVNRWLSRAEAFVRWVVAEFFGLELEEISRAVLIRDVEASGRVLLAESAAGKGDYRIALAHLRVAFESTLGSRRADAFSWTFLEVDIERAGREDASRRLAEVLRKVVGRLAVVDEIVQAISIGADPVESEWFISVAPVQVMTFGTAPFWTIHDEAPRSREDYLRGHDFVVSTLLKSQDLPPPEDPMARPWSPITETVLDNPPALAAQDPATS
jgi:hypothetical protein